MTVLEIIQAAVSKGLGMDRDNIPNDIISGGLDSYRADGKTIYDSFVWTNRMADQANFTPDSATGVITFGATVDDILAVKAVTTGGDGTNDTFIWPQDQINAAMLGENLSSAHWTPISDDTTTGYRRIQTQVDDSVPSYRVLYTTQFVPAIVDAAYDPLDPTATPTDYRVLEWPIDRANPVIVEAMTDAMAIWGGQKPKGQWGAMLNVAKNKIQRQSGVEKIVTVAAPIYGDTGNWW